MHDPSLFVDIEKNKLGVKYPIPIPPKDNDSYILQCSNGIMEWISTEKFKEGV